MNTTQKTRERKLTPEIISVSRQVLMHIYPCVSASLRAKDEDFLLRSPAREAEGLVPLEPSITGSHLSVFFFSLALAEPQAVASFRRVK